MQKPSHMYEVTQWIMTKADQKKYVLKYLPTPVETLKHANNLVLWKKFQVWIENHALKWEKISEDQQLLSQHTSSHSMIVVEETILMCSYFIHILEKREGFELHISWLKEQMDRLEKSANKTFDLRKARYEKLLSVN
jgi:hypothetical protein